jgi:hypothetical protein
MVALRDLHPRVQVLRAILIEIMADHKGYRRID